MKVIEGLKYTKEHEWIKLEGEKAYIGITDYAQHALGDIVFIELPQVGAILKKGGELGVIESVKTASDIYSPLSGEVIDVNLKLDDNPEIVNEEPYDSWIAILKLSDTILSDDLMDSVEYIKYCESEGEQA